MAAAATTASSAAAPAPATDSLRVALRLALSARCSRTAFIAVTSVFGASRRFGQPAVPHACTSSGGVVPWQTR